MKSGKSEEESSMAAPMLDGKDIDQDRNEGEKGESDGTTMQEAKGLIVQLF